MNRKTKYIILTVTLLTVLAAVMVYLGGRPAHRGETEETPVPESAAYVTDAPRPRVPSPPTAPEPFIMPPESPDSFFGPTE